MIPLQSCVPHPLRIVALTAYHDLLVLAADHLLVFTDLDVPCQALFEAVDKRASAWLLVRSYDTNCA